MVSRKLDLNVAGQSQSKHLSDWPQNAASQSISLLYCLQCYVIMCPWGGACGEPQLFKLKDTGQYSQFGIAYFVYPMS